MFVAKECDFGLGVASSGTIAVAELRDIMVMVVVSLGLCMGLKSFFFKRGRSFQSGPKCPKFVYGKGHDVLVAGRLEGNRMYSYVCKIIYASFMLIF